MFTGAIIVRKREPRTGKDWERGYVYSTTPLLKSGKGQGTGSVLFTPCEDSHVLLVDWERLKSVKAGSTVLEADHTCKNHTQGCNSTSTSLAD